MTSTTITESLDALQIERIIIVDDDVDRALEAEPASRLKIHVRELHDQLEVLGAKYPEVDLLDALGALRPDEELREALDSLWGELDETEREQLLSRVPGLVSAHLVTMFEQVAEHVDVVPRGVQSWVDADLDTLFTQDGPTTLVLFDLNLTGAGRGAEGGQGLLEDLRAKSYDNVFFGILTQDADTLAKETEMSASYTQASSHAVPVLGKFRLESADELALGLAAFVLAEDLHQIRRHTSEIIQDAATEAVNAANTLGYYILLAAARSANNEGLYEASGLVRMLSTLARRHTEAALLKAPPMAEISRLRQVLDSNPGFASPSDAEQKIIEDLYESAQHLLDTQAPTEVGDLYDFTDAQGQVSKYILLAQSCDLMVRKKGIRFNGDGHFVLAKVVKQVEPKVSATCAPHEVGEACTCVEEHQAPRKGNEAASKLIPLGRIPGEDGEWAVNLAARAFVPPDLLDACVFGIDGRSHFPLPTKVKVPNLAWEKRLGKLNSWWLQRRRCAVKHANDIQALSAEEKLKKQQLEALQLFALRSEFGRHFSETGFISVTQTKADLLAIEVGIRRIGRLTEPHAKAMLLQFSHYHSRPALPASLLLDAE